MFSLNVEIQYQTFHQFVYIRLPEFWQVYVRRFVATIVVAIVHVPDRQSDGGLKLFSNVVRDFLSLIIIEKLLEFSEIWRRM